jgi:hypothetical protein
VSGARSIIARDGMTGAPQHHDIHQRDDGLWEIGLGENSLGPFPNREFALSVAGHVPRAPAIPFRKVLIREVRGVG